MTSTVTKTVKSSGGDYSSLSAWEAGQQGDLTVSDTIQQAECYSFQDTTAVAIDGWTTSATQYIYVRTPSTERHDGKWNTGKYYLSTTGDCLDINEEYTRIEGLQFKSASNNGVQSNPSGTSDVRIESCIAKQCGFAAFLIGGGTCSLRNCIAYSSVLNYYCSGGTANIDNCVSVSGTYGIYQGGTVNARNCYSGNCGSGDYVNSPTLTTCASSDSTGTLGLRSIAVSTSSGAYFTNVTSGSEDYHIGSSSALKDAGTDLSATFTNDIDGQTRPTGAGTWDIGADEYVAAGGGSTLGGFLLLLGVGA